MPLPVELYSATITQCCPYCSEVECDPDCCLANWRPTGDDVRRVPGWSRTGETIIVNLSARDRGADLDSVFTMR
jgi:hypothetical protein